MNTQLVWITLLSALALAGGGAESTWVIGETASFYGASYVAVPLQDAKSTTDLRLRFRTRRSDAMLFLAAGRTDYCLVRLETGRLKVHINLGAGESEVASAKGLRLDDLMWHDVVITRKDADITLQVDSIHVTRETLPGRFYELNIHFGLFVGGRGDFSELFLGHVDNLRGCIADVIYNGVDVLSRARERIGSVDVHGVTWSCAQEFDAGKDRDISFVEEGAFMALPNAITRTGARWQLELKTSSRRGTLLYNTGLSSRSDFVGVELWEGRVRLTVDKGNGPAELISDASVSDGRWHSVAVQFNPAYLEITVDGRVSSLRLPLTGSGSRYLDLAETVYVGGIELNKRARALHQGVRSAEESFKGCLRGMELDGRRLGIPEARVTMGIRADCVWEYPCTGDPCVQGAVCLQQGVDSFRCECGQPLCVKPDYATSYKVFAKTTLPVDLEIIELTPLQVAEGSNALITTSNLDVVLDYPKFGVRDSGVIFRQVAPPPPRHGQLQVDVSVRRTEDSSSTVFTLLDVAKDKVRYLHDGSESHQDAIVLEMELSAGSGYVLPGYLQGRHRFVLPVNVTPVNDPPQLILQPGEVLRIAQGTKKTLTSELLHAEDPDNPNSDLEYTVLRSGGEGKGYIENSRSPGKSVDTFTQKDVDLGLISYVHRGGGTGAGAGGEIGGRVVLSVSDGIQAGPAAVLRVSAFELQLRLVNNTGLVLTHNTSAIITPDELSFLTNAEDQGLEVRYDVTQSPQYGVIQRLRGGAAAGMARWQAVDHFTSRQLARDQIRYQHTAGEPEHDLFKFKVSVMEARNPNVYDFRIKFVELRLEHVRNQDLMMDGIQEIPITEDNLLYQTKPTPTDPSRLVYHLIRICRYGALTLLRADPSGPKQQHRRLQPGDTFTQKDLADGKVRYRLHRRTYSRAHDDFQFRVTAPELSTEPAVFSISHVPGPDEYAAVSATVERLEVLEGGRATISRRHLHLQTDRIFEVSYNVTRGPHHGHLDVLDTTLTETLRHNASWFDSREITADKLIYVHDDSESKRDSFHFVALGDNFQYVGVFHVEIVLKNDNTPTRAVDRVFRVVSGGERLLTGRDLRYDDADIDSRPSEIVYTRRGIPNGSLLSASDPSKPVFEFTQEDLNEGRVLFRHEGEEYGKIGLWITDGQFYANGVLEVRASPPFVEITNATGLVVRRGGITTISSYNLSVETNVNAFGEQLQYYVVEGPRHGRLDVLSRQAEKFNERDLEDGRLTYRHDGSAAVRDHFLYRVDARGEASVEGRFDIRIFPASYWESLIVASNRTLEVEESTSVCICSSALKVMHPMIPSTDITFFVQKPPVNGYLEVEDNNAITDDFPEEGVHPLDSDPSSIPPPSPTGNPLGSSFQDEVTLFDQSLVDDSRLQYIQAVANATDDHFILDVTNGITWLRGLVVKLVVVPKNIFLAANAEVLVTEGGSVTLPGSLLVVLTGYYSGRVQEYRVVQQPMAGSIRAAHRPGKSVEKFTTRQLEDGQIIYQHNGSETLEDEFAVVGRAGDKESIPATIRIVVSPVNDEPPRLVNNTGLELWEGASAPVTKSHLAAVDPDSTAENITFTISSVKSGYVALRSSSRLPITQFTQAQINSGLILFVHMGGRSGGFRLTLSDGVNSGGTHDFEVTALDLTLRLAANNPLHVFPMLRQPLASDELLAVTSDPSPPGRRIVFTIRTPPVLGRLLVEPSTPATTSGLARVPLVPTARDPALPASNFTQQDVNENRVWYEHTHPFTDLMANDSFTFDVSADFAEPLLEQVFRIDISVSSMTSGGLDRFLILEPIEVDEGGSAVLRMNTTGVAAFIEAHSGWSPPVFIEVALWAAPKHGTLSVAGVNASSGTSFTQAQLDAGEVSYNHDHSDTTEDEVPFSLRLPSPEDSAPGDVLLYNGTIRVTIRPINDQPFHLLTRAPHVAVVQGGVRLITREDLCTEDPDTPPEELLYDVISGPSAGRLMILSNSSGANPGTVMQFPAVRFTQADINAERVTYEHAGPLAPASFYFRVWDGQFNPVYTVFNIRVLPLSLNVTRLAPIPIRQGSSVTFIEEAHLNLTTNGRRESVRYNVTQPPRHGTIFVHDVAVTSFGQADVDAKKVMYMQTDMTAPGDSFSLLAWLEDSDVKLPSMRFNVTVVPFINVGNFTPISGARNVVTPKFLDASPLAHLTSSNPTYTITRRPKLGRLKRIIRSTEARKVREKEVMRFTHEEVESGVIYYVAKRTEAPSQEDSFSFILATTIFQPAHGEVKFRVQLESYTRVQDQATAGVSSDATPPPRKMGSGQAGTASGTGNRPEVASPNMSNDYVLIVAVGAGVVTLAVLIIVAVKCRSLRTRDDRGASGKHHEARPGSAYGPGGVPGAGPNGDLYGADLDTAPPLPRPPDHLLPLHPTSPRPPRSKRFAAANGSTQRGEIAKVGVDSWRDGSPTVPQCKVIPLEPMDVGVVVAGGVVVGAGEAVDVNARYPYGVSDEPTEDWSSYDTSTELQYPPRTTNPMLRRNQYWV